MCEQREQLLDYLYEEASPTDRRAVERHLEGCEECRDEIRAFRNVREDLLAWGVPNPPSVWTAFAPAPVVPWHRQVPAWALAAAASVMFVVGSAGGFVAHSVVDGSGPAPAAQTEITQASILDSKAIVSLIREELANAERGSTSPATAVSNTSARPFQLDPKTEERLMTRVSALVNDSQQRQLGQLSNYLFQRAQEDDVQRTGDRRENARRYTEFRHQLDQLEAQVRQLTLAQAKGQ